MFDSNEELMAQIELGEDSVLEFKAMEFRGARIVGPDSRRIADEAAAMANVKGGVIVLGVEDATHAVVGIPLERLDQVETWARSLLFDSIQPPLAASIRRIRLPDARGRQVPCIRIDVPEGMTVHCSPNGYFQRIGSSMREFTPDELARQFQARTQASFIPYDEQFKPDTTPELISRKLCRRFKVRGIEAEEPTAFYRKMKLTTTDAQGVERLTTAGVLMATEEPERFFPSAYIQAVCYRGLVRDSADQLDTLDICGPLDEQIATACKFVRRNMRVYGMKDLGRTDIPQYSMTAVFEAITNAVAHRDYSITGSKIRLHMFKDRIELFSPGGLPDRMTVEELPYRQASRNELICSLLARCPMPVDIPDCTRNYVMDRRGEGVPVILERTKHLTGTLPEYRVLSESELLLTIKALPEGSVEKLQQKTRLIQQKTAEIHQKKVSVQQKTSDDSTEKSEMMMESILSLLRENPSISQKAVAAQLGTTRENIVYWFEKLKSKGRLIRRGPDKGGEWVVTK